jgi:Holliday junction resolvase-like predicted endonuclease
MTERQLREHDALVDLVLQRVKTHRPLAEINKKIEYSTPFGCGECDILVLHGDIAIYYEIKSHDGSQQFRKACNQVNRWRECHPNYVCKGVYVSQDKQGRLVAYRI